MISRSRAGTTTWPLGEVLIGATSIAITGRRYFADNIVVLAGMVRP